MANARVRRGRKTQDLAAEYIAARLGLPLWSPETPAGVRTAPASQPGRDILGIPGVAPEVKATRDGSLTGALKQAVRNALGWELPLVIWRPDGYGPEKIDDWVVALRFEDAVELIKKAGPF